jgi:hypothetical protein
MAGAVGLRLSRHVEPDSQPQPVVQILFIIIIGGMGSIGGNFLGAAFVVLPILLSNAGSELARIGIGSASCRTCRRSCSAPRDRVLIKEPDGLARLVQVARSGSDREMNPYRPGMTFLSSYK